MPLPYLPLPAGLPEALGGTTADLQRLFGPPLREYSQQVRDRQWPLEAKVVNDSVWKTVRLDPWEVIVLDSPVMQRLRNIRQLGLAHLVFPGAGYSRFEHSIGALHQSQRMVESMNRNARAAHRTIIPVRPSDEILLRLAALLHDIGHGFMSHVSERAMTSIVRLPGEIPARQMLKEARAYFGTRPALAEVLAGLIVRLPEFVELLRVADIP